MTQDGPARTPSTGGERQPSGFCPSPVTILEGPGPGPPSSASGVSRSVGVGVPLPGPSRPCPGSGHGPRAAPCSLRGSCLPCGVPRAWAVLRSCGRFWCRPSLRRPWLRADPTPGGRRCARSRPAAWLPPAPAPPCRGPGTRWSLWLSSVPTALLPGSRRPWKTKNRIETEGLGLLPEVPFSSGWFLSQRSWGASRHG